MEEKNLLTVGEVAKKMDVTVRTLQYYDKEGILKPSAKSEGGRRLYTTKDIVKLHQILSMKFLGFSLFEIKNNLISLDTPKEVVEILGKQKETVKRQIEELNSVLTAIEALQNEVSQMNKVDFNKYADIVSQLRLKNEGYWVVKLFDDKLMDHIKDRFKEQPNRGLNIFKKWEKMCDETIQLKEIGETPESERGQELAKEWWAMVMEFTGGDMSLLPSLMQFNKNKQGWNKELQRKQSIADEFIGKALEFYFNNLGIVIPEMEGDI